MAKQAEGCAVLRLSKAAAGVLEVLRKQFVRPGEVQWPKTCHVAWSSFEAQ